MRRLSRVICFGYSKEPSQLDSSFEHAKQMFKLMDKKMFTLLLLMFLFIWTCGMKKYMYS